MTLTIGSLFAGIGGLELGLERAGLGPVLWQAESDPFCRQVLAKHWPNARRYDDVRKLVICMDGPEDVDVICLGFPCQDISSAGKKEGIGGRRSGLWSEAARIIGLFSPRYVIVENVAALVHRGLSDVLRDLATLGYDAEWSVVSACALGAPHTRERLFILAYTDHEGEPASAFDEEAPWLRAHAKCVRDRWPAIPRVVRMADGVSRGMDRLRVLGNAVVPQVAEIVGQVILAREAQRTEGVA